MGGLLSSEAVTQCMFEEGDHPLEIDVQYTDSGFQLVMNFEQLRPKIEDDFGSFERIIEFYGTDPTELRRRFGDGLREVPDGEGSEERGLVINNPPKQWTENPSEAAPFIEQIHTTIVRFALGYLMEEEIEAQEELLNLSQFKPLIIRQSAFFESYLILQLLLEFQDQKGESLTTREIKLIRRLGHTDRVRLAHLFGVIDEDIHGILQQMASFRNDIAHNSWSEFDSQTESQIQSVAEKVHQFLKSEYQQGIDTDSQTDVTQDDNFDIGFSGLEPSLQLLQLSILDIIRKEGEETTLSRVQSILPHDDVEIRQRCLRMDHIGYISLNEESVRIEEKGLNLLGKEKF